MSIGQDHHSSASTQEVKKRYIVVSTDTHAGPSVARDLRQYCPKRHLEAFDQFEAEMGVVTGESVLDLIAKMKTEPNTTPLSVVAQERTRTCGGQADMRARLKDMDADGVAAEVIFAGGANGEWLPFQGTGFSAGLSQYSPELRALGSHVWNAWLADFISMEPHRHVGVMQIPIWHVESAVAEVGWAHAAGLRAVNLPAPRPDFPTYNEPIYDPLWAICEDLGVVLETHGGGGDTPLGLNGPGGALIYYSENYWLCQRGLWEMIFGRVFDRFPRLKLVFTEMRVAWVPQVLRDLDSIYEDQNLANGQEDVPERPPSEYWADNCYLSGSFLAPFEAELYDEVGRHNLMWGSDYPHPEGTWPSTRLAMRNTFARIDESATARILGLNAAEVFDFDLPKLEMIAQNIGPTPEELKVPVKPEELPAWRGRAFRKYGIFS